MATYENRYSASPVRTPMMLGDTKSTTPEIGAMPWGEKDTGAPSVTPSATPRPARQRVMACSRSSVFGCIAAMTAACRPAKCSTYWAMRCKYMKSPSPSASYSASQLMLPLRRSSTSSTRP